MKFAPLDYIELNIDKKHRKTIRLEGKTTRVE